MNRDIDVVPTSVGAASREWDEQHLQVTAAARQIGGAPTAGFSDGVVAAATQFVSAWEEHGETLGRQCEALADGMRVSIREYLGADEGAFMRSSALLPWLVEPR